MADFSNYCTFNYGARTSLEEYIYITLMYRAHHICMVIPIKHFVNQYGKRSTPHKLETVKKPSVSNIRFLFCQCVV